MCMEDYRLGRKLTTVESNPSITNGAFSELVKESRGRVALIISPPESGFILISIHNAPSANQGIRLQSTSPPLQLELVKHGDLVNKQLNAIHSAGTQIITVWETFMQDGDTWKELS